MTAPGCESCGYTGTKPDITGEGDEDILTISIECLMCLFTTENVINRLGIRKEEIKGEIPF